MYTGVVLGVFDPFSGGTWTLRACFVFVFVERILMRFLNMILVLTRFLKGHNYYLLWILKANFVFSMLSDLFRMFTFLWVFFDVSERLFECFLFFKVILVSGGFESFFDCLLNAFCVSLIVCGVVFFFL